MINKNQDKPLRTKLDSNILLPSIVANIFISHSIPNAYLSPDEYDKIMTGFRTPIDEVEMNADTFNRMIGYKSNKKKS